MATRSASIFLEEPKLGTALNHVWHACPEVLSAIYVTHYRHVLQVCRRFFQRPEDAEDAAADVFLKLHTVLHKKNDTKPFQPWVSQVAHRHCLDILRRRKCEKRSRVLKEDLTEIPDDQTPSALTQVLREEEHRQVREQLNRLPEHYKASLVMRYYKRMSYAEIAHKLNRQLPAVRVMIYRAKNRLRRNLKHLQRPDNSPATPANLPMEIS